MIDVEAIRARDAGLCLHRDERGRRLFAASEAGFAGYGGIAAAARATGLAPGTIGRGVRALAQEADPEKADLPRQRVRRPGGGRKPLTEADPSLVPNLMGLVSPGARGDPMSPLRWTTKSLRRLAKALQALGHRIRHTVVGEVLARQGFGLHANRKTREGVSHPDRDKPFAQIEARVRQALSEGQPVISVDTEKKALIGDFTNAGRAWRPRGDPEQVRVHDVRVHDVRVHDFLIKELGRAVPDGVYDLAANAAGSASGSTTIRRPLRCRRSACGGMRWAGAAIPRPAA